MTAIASPHTSERKLAPLTGGELRQIPLEQLIESPWNPRKHFDPAKLAETADSLRTNGQYVPLVVRPAQWPLVGKAVGDPGAPRKYEIGSGHRRYRAAPLAGLTSLLAIVRDMDDVAFLELLNIENKQRDDLEPLDEANGFRLLMEKAGYDVPKLAGRIGLSTKYVYDRLKLLQLTPEAKKLLEDGVITAGHAILLARLTPTDQKRAIGSVKDVADGGHRDSLLLEPDSAAEGDELALHDRIKPVSVREFKHAIEREIRAVPERTDPFLFPESAAALEAAKEEKLSVIHITRDWRVNDEARDEKIKTYGSQAWERADGAIEIDEDGRKTRSKPCAFSRYGFVAAGPGQGEVFKVCINKQKCAIHWPEQVRAEQERAKREKSRAKAKTAGPDAEARELAAEARATKAREAEVLRMRRVEEVLTELVKEHAPQWAREVTTIATQIKLPAIYASWMASGRLLEQDLENRIQYHELDDVEHAQEIFDAMRPKLGGGWSKRGYPETAAAQPVGLALLYWLDTQCAKREAALVKNAETVVKAEEVAAAKKAKVEKKPAAKKAKRK
jgi:ParB/RepB/Spo0J family partition protein